MKEKRVIETSLTSICLAGTVFFLCGVAIAWITFGIHWKFSFGDGPGSRADWVAAIGTWIIGSGAWKIARDSHQQRLREAASEEAREESARLIRVAWFSGQATTARSAFSVLLEAAETADSIQSFRSTVRVTSSVLRGLALFDADSASLSVKAVESLDFLGIDARRILDMSDSFVSSEIAEKNAAKWLEVTKSGFAGVARSAESRCAALLAELVQLSVPRN